MAEDLRGLADRRAANHGLSRDWIEADMPGRRISKNPDELADTVAGSVYILRP